MFTTSHNVYCRRIVRMTDIELEWIVITNFLIKNMRIYTGIFHEKYGNIVPSTYDLTVCWLSYSWTTALAVTEFYWFVVLTITRALDVFHGLAHNFECLQSVLSRWASVVACMSDSRESKSISVGGEARTIGSPRERSCALMCVVMDRPLHVALFRDGG